MIHGDRMCIYAQTYRRGFTMIYDLQKGSMTKRISAWLFDFIIVTILVAGLALLFSTVFGYDGYLDTVNESFDKYEKEYGVEFNISQEEYDQLTAEQQAQFEAATDALNKDQEAVQAYNMLFSLAILIASFSLVLAFLVWEFLIPLKLGNGQTLGKKIFSIAVMRTDGVKLNTVTLFVRAILGKLTVETMMPLLILASVLLGDLGMFGTVLLALLLLVQLLMLIMTHTNSVIHDKLANTVVVDMSSQMIFSTELDMIAYKERLAAQRAAEQKYF